MSPSSSTVRSTPVGYAKAIADYGLRVVPPLQRSFVASGAGKRVQQADGRVLVTYPLAYDPGPEICDHLEFALKHEGVSLGVLAALFRTVDAASFEPKLCDHIRSRPTGQYARRLWFLYEFLTGRQLPLANATQGNYVPLLDPKKFYTSSPIRSPRHRVLDNLLGNVHFCPVIRRTPDLQQFEDKKLEQEVSKLVGQYDEDALRRAVSYLYTKETRSSFSIEKETPSPNRTERFIALLRSVHTWRQLDEAALVQMQNRIVEQPFAEPGYRKQQNYVGEVIDLLRERIHYIPPRPEDVRGLMQGLLGSLERMAASGISPVVQAAAISFGFVFIHPFLDGNGRLHRLLIHYVLARTGFTPEGLIFPVSAVILRKSKEYDACLESFSEPLMQLVEYDYATEARDEGLQLHGETRQLYQYIDYTRMAEDLSRWIWETIHTEFRNELDFIVRYREARAEMELIIDMPDQMRHRFIMFCLQNGGRLSAAKRAYFEKLTDEQVRALEKVVQKRLSGIPAPRLA